VTLIPEFQFHRVFVEPWTTELGSHGLMALVTFLVGATCGLIGNFLILRRMALVGDAMSHSVLPGIAVAFLITGSRGVGAMVLGAIVAAWATHGLIEVISRHSRLKQDAAIGIAFSTLFAVGVVLIALFADKVDLDQDCVLNGELPMIPLEPAVRLGNVTLGPPALLRLVAVLLGSLLLLVAFYKELLLSSFDPGLAACLGIRVRWIHHGLMLWLSMVVVASFEAVGAILVIALLILPGATASLLTDRMVPRLLWSMVHAALSSVSGMHLSVALDCSPAGAAVVAGAGWFGVAWIFSPTEGLLPCWFRRRNNSGGARDSMGHSMGEVDSNHPSSEVPDRT
jgi:manganese/zinc/iron transport system permease protein